MLETLCGTTGPVPTPKGLAQPSPHLFPMENTQRSAQISKVMIPQTPKKSWRGHALPWHCPSASALPALHHCGTSLQYHILYPAGALLGGVFCPKPAEKEQQRIPEGQLIQEPPLSITITARRVGRGWIQPGVCWERVSTSQGCGNSKAIELQNHGNSKAIRIQSHRTPKPWEFKAMGIQSCRNSKP